MFDHIDGLQGGIDIANLTFGRLAIINCHRTMQG
jgi:hypothetical protein